MANLGDFGCDVSRNCDDSAVEVRFVIIRFVGWFVLPSSGVFTLPRRHHRARHQKRTLRYPRHLERTGFDPIYH